MNVDKGLPPDPAPWQPPPERWFDRHEHTAGTTAMRTLTAMRVVVYDRVGLIESVRKHTVTPAENELLQKCLKRYPDDLMSRWRERCAALRPVPYEESADLIYTKLLAEIAKGADPK